jgi:phosphatidylinositol-bisphosphatase
LIDSIANPFINPDATTDPTQWKILKRRIMSTRLRQQESDFSTFESMKIYVGTWNVNGKSPTEDIGPWLLQKQDDMPDIFALGFQEADMSTEAYIISDNLKPDEWTLAVLRGLGQYNDQYVKVSNFKHSQ